MATDVRITESEILEELSRAIGASNADAQTLEDLIETTGLSKGMVRKALHRYAKDGRLAVHKVLRPAIDGRQCYRPGYTILPAARKKR